MTRVQTDIGRFYVTDGIVMPSVTTVLNIVSMPWLAEWRGRVGNACANSQLQIASLFGTEVHQIIEDLNCGKRPVVKDIYRKHIVQYLKWHKQNVKSVIASEQFVYDKDLGYAGTLDMVAKLRDGTVAMVDFKTSDHMSRQYYMQLAAYREACRQAHNIDFDRSVIVKISRTGAEMSIHESSDHDSDFEAFKSAIHLFNWYYQDEITKISQTYNNED